MNTFLAAGLLVLAGQSASTPSRPITLNFSQTEVGQIFRAIGLRTGMSIIYSGPEKQTVTLHFTASNPDEAIRGTASAAGLAYRKVGKVVVVSKPDSLKQALAPFSQRAQIRVPASVDLVAQLEKCFPMLTILASGPDGIYVVGVPEDVEDARKFCESYTAQIVAARESEMAQGQLTSESVSLRVANPAGIIEVLRTLYPNIKVIPVTGGGKATTASTDATRETKGTATPESSTGSRTEVQTAERGGTLIILGREKEVVAARKKALELDTAASTLVNADVFRVYRIRYASPRSMIGFLAQMAPEVQAAIAPPSLTQESLQSGVQLAIEGSEARTPDKSLSDALNAIAQKPVAGADGTTTSTTPTTSTDLSRSADRAKNLVLKGRAADVEAALRLLEQVDVKPAQVVVDVRVVDSSPETLEALGVKYDWTSFQFREVPKGTYPDLNAYMKNTARPPGLGALARLPWSINALLDLAVTKTDTKLLANPSIRVVDNEEANFFVGNEYRYSIQTAGPLGSQSQTVEKVLIGIALNVRPRVSGDGSIQMQINPTVNSLLSVTSNGLPQISSRTATTSMIAKDGETIVLGGLIRDEDVRTVQEIPLLAQLPIVGQLFRHTDRNHRKSNVIVTITPHIVQEPEMKK